jgi:hypothetical protein
MEKQSKTKYFQCNLREGYLMKKLALALIVALGVASVNAAPTATDSDVAAALTKSVPNLKLDAVKKNAAISWIKAHPVIVASVAAAVLAGLVYGAAYKLQSNAEGAKWYNRAANNVLYAVQVPAQKVGAACTTAATHVSNHKLAYGIPAGVATVVIAAVIDMYVHGDKSVVKYLWHKIKPAQKPAVVPAPAQ